MTETYIFLVFVLSSFLQTVTGFGYAVITAPLLALALGAKETVMLVMLTGLIIRFFVIRATLNQGSFTAVLPLTLASIVGAVPGAYVLTMISNDGLKVFIGIILLLATVALWKNFTLPIRRNLTSESIVGIISGFLATTTSIGGPPVVIYYLNVKAEEHKDLFRANLTRYFLLINIISIFISYVAGTFKISELWFHAFLSVPAIYIGFYLGDKLFHRINSATFRNASLLMVLISSLAIIGSVFAK